MCRAIDDRWSSVIDVFHCTWSPALILSSISKIYDIRIEDFGLAWNSGSSWRQVVYIFGLHKAPCRPLWSDCAQDKSELISQFLQRKPHVWAALLRHLLVTWFGRVYILWPGLSLGQVWGVVFLGIHRCWRTIQAWKRCIFVGGLISRWVVGYCRSEYHTWHSQTKKFHKELWIIFLCFTCFCRWWMTFAGALWVCSHHRGLAGC